MPILAVKGKSGRGLCLRMEVLDHVGARHYAMLILPGFECALRGETKPPMEMDFAPSELGAPARRVPFVREAIRIAVERV
ncbi:MAG: hypothetical protein OXG82_05645 [Gammaproteobacteria bacterium]|nr:hypothetical protein [Gammaproteobacteria bacterium]